MRVEFSLEISILDEKEDAPITGPLGAWSYPLASSLLLDDQDRVGQTADLVEQVNKISNE